MKLTTTPPPNGGATRPMSREQVLAWGLILATALTVYLCYLVVEPFLPALAWALALAVIAHPVHRWLLRRLPRPNLCAAITVVMVAVLIVGPMGFVSQSLIREAGRNMQMIQSRIASGKWRAALEHSTLGQHVRTWLEPSLGPTSELDQEPRPSTDDEPVDETGQRRGPSHSVTTSVAQAAGMITQGLGTLVTGTVWVGMQLFITLLSLFYFLRDRHRALDVVRSLVPLSEPEATTVFQQVDDTIHATIYGSLMVAIVQGAMGGLIFWFLGLASPLFWGTVMGLLAVVPVLGTFVIWAPTAAYLALNGEVSNAIVLVAWGGIAIGLIDNLLYPYLIGQRLRFHPLLVFFAMLGGLSLFGASGVILGPLLLAIADALLEIWRRRTPFELTPDDGTRTAAISPAPAAAPGTESK